MTKTIKRIMSGAATDGSAVAAKFATHTGVPVMISMAPSLAQETIDKIAGELDRLGTLRPIRKN